MKGVRRMVFALTTAVMTMACQGCVSVSPHDQVRSEPAVPPSLGMQMAAPAGFAGGVLRQEPAGMSVHVVDSTPNRFTGVSTGPVGPAPAFTTVLNEQPADFDVGATTFTADNSRLDWTGNETLVAVAAERSRAALSNPGTVEKNIAAEIAISAPKEVTGLNFDLGLAPRVAVREEGEILTRRVGGEVRIGQDLNILNGDGTPDGWYIFAGADGEALVWDANKSGFAPSLGDMALTDQVTVGDLQAGISIQRGGGELSLSYIRREVKYSDRNVNISETEDFAGISFTMRR